MFFAFSLLLFHFPCFTFDISRLTFHVWRFSFLPFYFCLLLLIFYSFSCLNSLIKIVFNFPVLCYQVNLFFRSLKQFMPCHNQPHPSLLLLQLKYIQHIFLFNQMIICRSNKLIQHKNILFAVFYQVTNNR